MKVIHTEWSNGWGGQEIRILQEMLAVRERGIEVFLACREDSQIALKAHESGIKVFSLPFKGNLDFYTLFRLMIIIRKYKIQILNSHSGKDTWVGGLAAKFSRIKFIRTRHLSNPIKTSRSNFINELADFIFTTGESVRDDMIKNNRISSDRIKSIPTGIDLKIFDPKRYDQKAIRNNLKIGSKTIVIGIVAVLRRFKRHDRFFKMAEFIVKNSKLKIKFLVVGDGPLRNKFHALVVSKKLEDFFIFTGHVDNVAEILSLFDIFLLTSDSGEGVPQSLMQALAMNKAVISTNAGSIKDLYHQENFILVDNYSQSKLNNHVLNLLSDKKLRENFAKNSGSFVRENFSLEKMTNDIIQVYKRLL